jgi:hypothetical protein
MGWKWDILLSYSTSTWKKAGRGKDSHGRPSGTGDSSIVDPIIAPWVARTADAAAGHSQPHHAPADSRGWGEHSVRMVPGLAMYRSRKTRRAEYRVQSSVPMEWKQCWSNTISNRTIPMKENSQDPMVLTTWPQRDRPELPCQLEGHQ